MVAHLWGGMTHGSRTKPDRIIGPHAPHDGRWWECQCARCGSSTDDGESCWQCGGEAHLGSDCIDDLCHGGECIHGDSGVILCDICQGEGCLPPRCLSGADWCEAHPMAGREDVKRGTLEWFVVEVHR